MIAFFDKTRWKENKKEAQARYGDKWKEEYFKNPREVYRANLKDCYKEKLGSTHLYILISSHKQAEKYGEKVVGSLEANAQHLQELGVTPHIIVRCDGDRENGGVTEDIYCYAGELEEKGISFKLHESANVNMKDLTFEGNDPEHAHWELVANEKNLGCSGSRHASIDAIEKEVKELCAKGERVYIGIFDGDDFIHPDFYLLLTANAIHTGATVSNYNGKIGAHGLQKTSLFMPYDEPFFGSTAKKKTYWLYRGKNNFGQNDLDASREKELGGWRKEEPSLSGVCCTTRIFEAEYFYDTLNALVKQLPNGNRHAINLIALTPLDGFNNEACTCTTEKSLFFYNEKGKLEDLSALRHKESGSLEKESKEPDCRSCFKVQ